MLGARALSSLTMRVPSGDQILIAKPSGPFVNSVSALPSGLIDQI
jgi:hypothetical protein